MKKNLLGFKYMENSDTICNKIYCRCLNKHNLIFIQGKKKTLIINKTPENINKNILVKNKKY